MQILREFLDKYVELNDDEWALLEPSLKIRHFKKGETIARKGDVWSEYIYIYSGIIRSYIQNEAGRDFTRQIYFNTNESRIGNLFVVDLTSILTQAPSYRGFEVLADSEVLVFSKRAISLLYDQSKSWERFGRKMSELAYLDMDRFYYSLLTQTTKERYQNLTNNMSDLIEKVPQYHIATYLGVTPESLSRIKKDI